jgi:tetratricopeptide (TPR) repeat protein
MEHLDLEALQKRLHSLYAQGENEALIAEGERWWPSLQQASRHRIIGSVLRYPMLAHYRLRQYQEGDVWWQRAMEQFAASHDLGGIAVLLVTPVLRSLDAASELPAMGSVALMTMQAIGALAQVSGAGDEAAFTHEELSRIYHEKYAYCLFRMRRYAEAVREYDEALRHAKGTQDIRGQLKVRGGRTLAAYFVPSTAKSRERTAEELSKIERRLRSAAIWAKSARPRGSTWTSC